MLERSQLLQPESLDQARCLAEGEVDPWEVAKQLIDRQTLTKWQAIRLLAGSDSFFIERYKLVDCLGQGATGTVFKAADPHGQAVAVKVLSADAPDGQDVISRFRREVRLAAALDHPHLVMVHDAGEVDGQHYLVTEFIEGRDLKFWVNHYSPLPVDWACECIRQTALGLQHASEHGIVHRDVKPGNILVLAKDFTTPPVIKVLDLGVASVREKALKGESLTKMGEILGTPDYMSPEQAQNPKDADIRADIFSLGCTLFHLLTGRPPYLGATPMEKLNARLAEDAPRLRSLREDVPQSLDDIVAKMLERDPDKRFQTPAEVARLLAPLAMTGDSESESEDVPAWRPLYTDPLQAGGEGESRPASQSSGLKVYLGGAAVALATATGVLLAVGEVPQYVTLTTGTLAGLALGCWLVALLRGSTTATTSAGRAVQPSIDLLAGIDPHRDSVEGAWQKLNHVLTSPDNKYARLQIPFHPPEEYELELVAERKQGNAALVVGLVAGGRQFSVVLDGWGGTISGLGLVDGQAYDSNGTTHRGKLLGRGSRHRILCRVDRDAVEVEVDGQLAIEYRSSFDRLSLFDSWHVPDDRGLILGSIATVYSVYEIRLTSLGNPVPVHFTGRSPLDLQHGAGPSEEPSTELALRR